MGLFGNNETKEFKDKFVGLYNLVVNYSCGDVLSARQTTLKKIEVSFQE